MNTLRDNPEFHVPCIFLGLIVVLLLSACSLRSFQIKKAEALYNKGQALEIEGQQDKALSKFNESMALAEKAGFRPGVANNLNEIAIIATRRGEYEKARALFGRALRIYREMDWKPEVSKSLNNVALTYLKELNFEGALNGYRELLEWDAHTGNRLGEIITLNNTGFIYDHYLGNPEEARRSYQRALGIARELGNRKYIGILEEKLQIR